MFFLELKIALLYSYASFSWTSKQVFPCLLTASSWTFPVCGQIYQIIHPFLCASTVFFSTYRIQPFSLSSHWWSLRPLRARQCLFHLMILAWVLYWNVLKAHSKRIRIEALFGESNVKQQEAVIVIFIEELISQFLVYLGTLLISPI